MIWERIAALRSFGIPDEQLAEIVPILEKLAAQIGQALDRDLSTTEPALTFRCDVRLSPGEFDLR